MAGAMSHDVLNRYWLPKLNINKKVIVQELQYYLGPEATVRPYTRDGEDGFRITTPGECLTDEQIDDICRKSETEWEKQAIAGTKSNKRLIQPLWKPVVISRASTSQSERYTSNRNDRQSPSVYHSMSSLYRQRSRRRDDSSSSFQRQERNLAVESTTTPHYTTSDESPQIPTASSMCLDDIVASTGNEDVNCHTEDVSSNSSKRYAQLPAPTDLDQKDETQRHPCPYWVRDRGTFGSQTRHHICAGLGWKDIAKLKEHLYRHHHFPYQCQRCNLVFKGQEQLDQHAKEEEVCQSRPRRLDDGITHDIFTQLRKKQRTKPGQPDTKWDTIFELLFPTTSLKSRPSEIGESDAVSSTQGPRLIVPSLPIIESSIHKTHTTARDEIALFDSIPWYMGDDTWNMDDNLFNDLAFMDQASGPSINEDMANLITPDLTYLDSASKSFESLDRAIDSIELELAHGPLENGGVKTYISDLIESEVERQLKLQVDEIRSLKDTVAKLSHLVLDLQNASYDQMSPKK